jgi:hypothetical protein
MTDVSLLLLIAGVVVAAGYYGFRFLKNLISRPVLEIHLSPVDEPRWRDRNKIAELISSLQQKGFESAGHYTCLEIPSLIISGFIHPSEQMAGAVYDHPVRGIWADIFVHYTDGGSLTVSNADAGHEVDHMPQQAKIYCKGSSVGELVQKVMAERKEGRRITIRKEEFASLFEAQYKKEMKWRSDRGGATYLEVHGAAEEMGASTDRERLEERTHQLQENWEKEKEGERRRPAGLFRLFRPFMQRGGAEPTGLPLAFERPEEFRRKAEEKGGPAPRLGVQAFPVYLVLIAAMACWCYYGWQYNEIHFPVTLTAISIFFGVFLLLFLVTMVFRQLNRRVKMYPVLRRMADLRPGAFLVVEGTSPALFYARERWIGKALFEEGGETENAFTLLDARMRQPLDGLEIRKKGILAKLTGGPKKEVIRLPESDFSRGFIVSGTESEFTRKFLNQTVLDAIMRCATVADPIIRVEGHAVRVEVGKDLSSPHKEAALRQFLEEAETIIESASQASIRGSEKAP